MGGVTDVPTEADVRSALRRLVSAETGGSRKVVEEFWVPMSHERADIVVIGARMDGFEIKTERDTLRRLPRQAAAYQRLFDRCTLVLAEKHRSAAVHMLPEWWGITTIRVNGPMCFEAVRQPRVNPSIDPATLVRLLWRDEAMSALLDLGMSPQPRASRTALWLELLRSTSLDRLSAIVRHALLLRDNTWRMRPLSKLVGDDL